MERVNQFDFYALARKLGQLNQFNEQDPVDAHAAFWASYWGQTNVAELLSGKPIELGVSRGKAEALLAELNSVITRRFTAWDEGGKASWKLPDEGSIIQGWEWGNIRRTLADFELVFAEEQREGATYRVPNRGIYNTRKLVDEAQCTFPPEVDLHIPEGAKLEWRAAGRCLAFGMFTACGFHVARGVEVVLEAYFHAFNGGSDKRLKNWGHYIDALEKIAAAGGKPTPGEKVLGELRQLKDDWRNPLMHPRVVLQEPDARAVFNNGETLVMMMAQELAQVAASVTQPAIPQLVAPEEDAA